MNLHKGQMVQKTQPFRSRKTLDRAKSKSCLIKSPYCVPDDRTTVPAHSNSSYHDKGSGTKASDITADSCYACHDFVDGRTHAKDHTQQEREWYLWRGIVATVIRRFKEGAFKVV